MIALVIPAIDGSACSKQSRSGTRTWNRRSRRLFHSIVPSTRMARAIAKRSQRGVSIDMGSAESELLVEHIGDLVLEPVPEAALAPGPGIETLRACEIGREGGAELAGDPGVD